VEPINGVGRTPIASTGSRPPQDNSKRVADAAQQFESLLMAQLLKSMRESGAGGWLGTGDDQAGSQAMELAEEQMAQALAQRGGLGLARLVVSGLQKAPLSQQAGGRSTPAQKLQP
jgi:Rod binding domain-containing protein